VRVEGTVTDLTKLGDRWRAELRVGGEELVVLAQAGAGIPYDTLAEGRTATITGIVRRPYPTAGDQRFAILPRYPADIRTAAPRGGSPIDGPTPAGPAGTTATASANPAPPPGIDVDLTDLAAHAGATVRVGGLVTELVPDGVVIHDGTAQGTVVLRGEAAELLPLIEPGDAINATGLVEAYEGVFAVVVTDPAGLALAGDLAAGPGPAGIDDGSATTTEANLVDAPGTDPGLAGLGSLAAIAALSVAVTVLRRWQSRRRLGARIAARLAAFAGPQPVDPGDLPDAIPGDDVPLPEPELGPRSAEHASRTRGSA
jgi:hypothetical protein